MNGKYIVKQTIDYQNGICTISYLKSISFAVFATGQIQDAKKYRTKAEAKKDISIARSGQRRRNVYYEILSIV